MIGIARLRGLVRDAPTRLAAGTFLAVAMLLAAPVVHRSAAGSGVLAADPSAVAPSPSGLIASPPDGSASPSGAASAEPASPQTPTATPAVAGDPRSSGEGAGLVGAPLFALGGMLLVGLLAAAGTLLYVRLTGGPRAG